MHNNQYSNCVRWVLILTVLSALGGCSGLLTSIVTPNVNTNVVDLKPGQYQLDKSHASVLFKIQHLGLSTYVGRFNDVDASLEFDPTNIAASTLTAVIEMGSLDINDDSLKQDLMGGTWFNQKQFPQAIFTTKRVIPNTENSFDFVGELNWRGVVQELVMNVTFNGGANNMLTGKYTLGFSATGSFKRSDFGMDAFIPLVGDEVALEAFAEFQRN